MKERKKGRKKRVSSKYSVVTDSSGINIEIELRG
jgi:hypothetical protein